MQEQNYLSCTAYQNQPLNTSFEGFTTFFNEETQQYYFALLNAEGAVYLKSEGYPEEKSQIAGLKSVQKNLNIEKRYKTISEEGVFFISLRAGNHKEIARSCNFNTAEEAAAHIQVLSQYQPVNPVVAVVTENETAAVTEDLAIFEGHDRIWDKVYGRTGYATFEQDANAYFVVYNDDESVYLRSKAFTATTARDAALESLQQYITQEDAYQVVEENGVYFTVVKDAKGTEIAKSLAYPSFILALITTPAGREKEITDAIF